MLKREVPLPTARIGAAQGPPPTLPAWGKLLQAKMALCLKGCSIRATSDGHPPTLPPTWETRFQAKKTLCLKGLGSVQPSTAPERRRCSVSVGCARGQGQGHWALRRRRCWGQQHRRQCAGPANVRGLAGEPTATPLALAQTQELCEKEGSTTPPLPCLSKFLVLTTAHLIVQRPHPCLLVDGGHLYSWRHRTLQGHG